MATVLEILFFVLGISICTLATFMCWAVLITVAVDMYRKAYPKWRNG